MYKLFISDFDGTLIDSDEAIPLSTMVEIDRIRKLGVKFCIATGRILKSVLDYNKDFPFLDYVISCDGAYVYDVCNRKPLFKKPLGSSIVKKIRKLYSDCDIYFCTVREWNLCHGDVVHSELKKKTVPFEEFYHYNKDNIYKLQICFKTKKERDSAYSELQELGIKANLVKIEKGKKKYLIDITNRDVHKVIGLEKICKKEHVSLEQVVCVGDNDNDIPIFLSVGKSVAVANGSKNVKKVASMQTSSNETKGVEKVIKKLF